jgi:ubiquinone/menaquinone biosynthesis C-methylase UbiE
MLKKSKNKNLLEKSDIYYKMAEVYEAFTQAEDAPNLIYKTLLPIFKGKNILDIGCGTGKYMKLFAPYAKSITGVDAAENQLLIAKEKTKNINNVELFCSDIAETSFSKLYDVAFASWVLGTITNEEKRLQVLNNIKNSLTENGKIFLVENDVGGEFEDIRGRINDPEKRTESYNNWLKKQRFEAEYRFETNFEFSTVQQAKKVIDTIWGSAASKKVTKKCISHRVVIFIWSKN